MGFMVHSLFLFWVMQDVGGPPYYRYIATQNKALLGSEGG